MKHKEEASLLFLTYKTSLFFPQISVSSLIQFCD